MAWGSLWVLGRGLGELGDSLNSVLAAAEDASVRGVVRWDEFKLGDSASWMRFLYSACGHGVRDYIERVIHVLLEEAHELVTDEKSLGRQISHTPLPHDVLLALGWESLVLGSVKEVVLPDLFEVRAAINLVIAVLELRHVHLGLYLVCAESSGQTGKSNRILHNLIGLYSTS